MPMPMPDADAAPVMSDADAMVSPLRRSGESGTPCWVELQTTDRASATTFYGELFGWRIDDLTATTTAAGHQPDQPGYSVARKNNDAVAGIACRAPASAITARWATYLAVDDVDEVVRSVGNNGGTVTMGPVNIIDTVIDASIDTAIDTARIAVVRDPTGATVGLWQSDRLAGTTVVNEDGRLAWIELLTDDVDAAVGFYQRVFGLAPQAVELSGRPWFSLHSGPATNTPPVAGVVGKLSMQTPNHWNVYFGCDDIDRTARRAVELGGSVVFGPAPTPIGPMAGIMDPHGARFSLWGLSR